jgi:hypothetical protein
MNSRKTGFLQVRMGNFMAALWPQPKNKTLDTKKSDNGDDNSGYIMSL